ncbi:MAG: hypothetical protein JNK48_34525 [Bryobacterales bacterium]|nr:hypothetical protein [Bryobacterales bacterium]
MPISEAHSAAARENAAHSTGPVTPEGKAKSSQNARKLGLFAASVQFLDDSEQNAYHELLEGYLEELRPESILEHRHVREMVNAEWRLSLLRGAMLSYESQHMDASAPSPCEARATAFGRMSQSGNAVPLFLRYEKQLQRQFDKAHNDFLAARRLRLAELDAASRARNQYLLRQLHAIANAPPPGFSRAKENMQNEPKPAPHNSQNPPNPPFNPAVYTKAAPANHLANLSKT